MQKNSKSEKYFYAICETAKNMQEVMLSGEKMRFNKTEFRLLNEIIAAKNKGERLISTRLADRLGITRSAVSQMVKRLEEQGVVRRVPDPKDKKIAYVEITDETMQEYGAEIKDCVDIMGRVVGKFGEENFNRMCELFKEFFEVVKKEKIAKKEKKSNA